MKKLKNIIKKNKNFYSLYLRLIRLYTHGIRKWTNYQRFKCYYRNTSDKYISEALDFMEMNGISMFPFFLQKNII